MQESVGSPRTSTCFEDFRGGSTLTGVVFPLEGEEVSAEYHIGLGRFPYPGHSAICASAMAAQWIVREAHNLQVLGSSTVFVIRGDGQRECVGKPSGAEPGHPCMVFWLNRYPLLQYWPVRSVFLVSIAILAALVASLASVHGRLVGPDIWGHRLDE